MRHSLKPTFPTVSGAVFIELLLVCHRQQQRKHD